MGSSEKLNIFEDFHYDTDVIEEKWVAHTPATRAENFSNSDSITITIDQRDILTSIADSYLYVEGKITPVDDKKAHSITNNPISFAFEELKLSINDVEIESVRKPGITSTMKAMATYNSEENKALGTAGWISPTSQSTPPIVNAAKKTFSAIIPLNMWFGFAEDYNKYIVWAKQQLTLIRARTDKNCYKGETDVNISFTKLEWHVPQVRLSDEANLRLLRQLQKESTITAAFRKKALTVVPGLRVGKEDVILLSSVKPFEKPRYCIIGFQTGKDNTIGYDASKFDHVKIRNITLYIHSTAYPSRKWNLNYDDKSYVEAYKAFCDFQISYIGREKAQPMMTYEEFLSNPIFVIDCSKQSEAVQSGSISLSVEFEASENFPANTHAYLCLIHDTLITHSPINGKVTTL